MCHVYIWIYLSVIYVYILALSPKKHRNNDTPGALNVCRTQILVSKDHSPFKGTRVPWRKADFSQKRLISVKKRTRWVWNILFHKKVKKCSKRGQDIVKEHRSQLKGAPTGQIKAIWTSKGTMTIIDYNSLNKIGIHNFCRY